MVRHKLPPPAPEKDQPPFPPIVGKNVTKPHVVGQPSHPSIPSPTQPHLASKPPSPPQHKKTNATTAECVVLLDGEPVKVKAKVDQKTGLVQQADIKAKDQDQDEMPFKVTPIQVASAAQASLLTKEPKLPQATPLAAVIGPLLHYRTTDPAERRWYGSVLMIVADVSRAPVITLEDPIVGDNTTNLKTLVPRLLDQSWEYNFYRYDIDLPVREKERRIQYRVVKFLNINDNETETEYFGFWIPGKGQSWRWSFWSCSGFDYTADPKVLGGHEPVWRDLVLRHSQLPLHAMIGGGDQVYMDRVFTDVEELALWLNVKDRQTAPFTPGIRKGAERFYLEAYCRAFSSSVIREALASIPSIMVIDDHDIFDGYGSYRDKIQESPVLEGVGSIAFRFYRLFQLHTTLDHFEEDGIFGHGTSGTFLSRFGSDVLVLGYDARSERSIDQIASPESYEIMFSKLEEALEHPSQPRHVKHLAVLLTVPIVYPKFDGVEKILRAYAFVKKHTFGRIVKLFRAKSTKEGKNLLFGLQKRGIFRHLLTQMDHVELADDLADHWTAPPHRRERLEFIQRLQAIAFKHSVRVTFFSGDVHLAALGLLRSSPQGCLVTSNTTLAGWCDPVDLGAEKNVSEVIESEPDLSRNSADMNGYPVRPTLTLADLNPVIKTVKKQDSALAFTDHTKFGSKTKLRDRAPPPPQITSYTHTPSRDPRWMAQITSSAIVNTSPPQAVVNYLHKNSKTCLLDDFTVEKMVKIFKEDTDNEPLKIKEVLSRRNYSTVEPDGDTGGLVVKLRMEISPGRGQTKAYAFTVPPLVLEREQGKVVEW